MKRTIILLVVTIAVNLANAQGCLSEGISFYTQEQIDNFQINYPGCTEIEGDVMIYGSEITNLNGLNILTTIWGWFEIDAISLTSLTGLENLNAIGVGLSINSSSLTSLSGLDNLYYSGFLIIDQIGRAHV